MLKIADFGLSDLQTKPNSLSGTLCGSPLYAAPELMTEGAALDGYDATKTDKLVAADVAKAATAQGYTKENMATSQLYTQANMATQNGFDLTKMTAQEQTDLKKMGAAFGYNLQLADAGQKAEIAKMAVAQDYLEKAGYIVDS